MSKKKKCAAPARVRAPLLPPIRIFICAALAAAAALTATAVAGTGTAGTAGTVAEPPGYRLEAYRAPVPAGLSGARTVTAAEVRTLLRTREGVLIDVYPRPPKPANLPKGTLWRDPPHQTIPGAVWLPNTGFGVLPDGVAAYFTAELARLAKGNKSTLLIFFCQRDCWMSWNAAKRALALGYRHVAWFPDGTDGWLEEGGTLAPVEPLK